MTMLREIKPTPTQQQALDEAHIAFMDTAGFFSHFYYDQMREVITPDVPTLATDGRHVYINPEYLTGLKTGERVFALIHETIHAILHHPQRMKFYQRQGNLRGLSYNTNFANMCADYCINSDILDAYGKSVQFNPEWLFDPEIKPGELWEDVYERKFKQPPANQPGQGKPCEEGEEGETGRGEQPKKFRDDPRSLKGAKGDDKAKSNNGRFDEVLEPPIDPTTGEEDLPGPEEFKESIARAEAAQKSQGEVPGVVKRIVKEILEPEIDWRDKIRVTVTGRIGRHREDWARPNRRRLVLRPLSIIPGKSRWGAGTVVVAQDTSGSMGTREEAAGLAELGAILSDVRPREIIRLCCDARVGQVDYVRTIEDFEEIRDKGTTGGGGTDFRPVFKWIEDNEVEPECLVYVTDTMGTYPDKAPLYPVIWVSTLKPCPPACQPKFGELVEIDLKQSEKR